MSERRYTDEEVASIFERASESEHTPLPAPADRAGVTLAALQEIAREVGISPEAIARAAETLELPGGPTVKMFLGTPIGVGRTVEFSRPVTDADWERLVADLRTTFDARGKVRYDGPFREWTNGNLHALLEPTPQGHRLRIQTTNGNSRVLMTGGILVMGMALATLAAVMTGPQAGNAGSLAGPGFLGIIGLGMFGSGALRLPAWARRRREQIEAVITRAAIAASARPASAQKTPV
jgi:hypothetical protein